MLIFQLIRDKPCFQNMAYLISFLLFIACSTKEFYKEPKEEKPPIIVEVYPTSDTLPENLLRFYIQFSRPMKAVNNLESIKLLNQNGEEIKGAIFNNVYELWDSEQTQLTLILDPARVKTGLVANETLGRALVPSEKYQLVIEKAEDVNGNPLKESFVKSFFVKKSDTEIPDINKWKIIPPKSNSTSPLQIYFPQSLDRLSMLHRIRLLGENKSRVEGKIEILNQEKSWFFHPVKKWKTGKYILQVNSRLEDPSGNNMNGLFDHEIGSLKNREEGEILELSLYIF